MQLPKIAVDTLPLLNDAAGMFGSLMMTRQPGMDDRIIILMVWLYEVAPPQTIVG